ncbi:hypothetical protein EVAR_76069_1 [Eumeta japonica]|uniref:Uncharacterized protein n=1 Tax=Eumeta variegata TaxID=151549 RepID=A0A4C1W6H6_EUMVA|nr:hypothetical protein EVAR_76069_1 [Eumeta japonica]
MSKQACKPREGLLAGYYKRSPPSSSPPMDARDLRESHQRVRSATGARVQADVLTSRGKSVCCSLWRRRFKSGVQFYKLRLAEYLEYPYAKYSILARSCAAAVSLLLGRVGRWRGREIAHSALSLARSAQAERDNESCYYVHRLIKHYHVKIFCYKRFVRLKRDLSIEAYRAKSAAVAGSSGCDWLLKDHVARVQHMALQRIAFYAFRPNITKLVCIGGSMFVCMYLDWGLRFLQILETLGFGLGRLRLSLCAGRGVRRWHEAIPSVSHFGDA